MMLTTFHIHEIIFYNKLLKNNNKKYFSIYFV